jgi:hypothetical protein
MAVPAAADERPASEVGYSKGRSEIGITNREKRSNQ